MGRNRSGCEIYHLMIWRASRKLLNLSLGNNRSAMSARLAQRAPPECPDMGEPRPLSYLTPARFRQYPKGCRSVYIGIGHGWSAPPAKEKNGQDEAGPV